MSNSILLAELRLSAELIVAEAKRWSVAEEVGLQVTPTRSVRVTGHTTRARQFVEHLASLQSTGSLPTSDEGARSTVGRAVPSSARASICEWDRIVELAKQVDGAAASGSRVSSHLALRLARSVLTLDTPNASSKDAAQDRG